MPTSSDAFWARIDQLIAVAASAKCRFNERALRARWSDERADDGAEFIATAVQEWLARIGVMTLSIALGWILDHDEVILAAYRSSPRRLSDHRALWEARSGRKASWWSIWDGEHFTGEMLADRTAAEIRLLQLSIARSQPRAASLPAND